MAGIRVLANGPGAKLGAALTPVPAACAGAWQSRGPVVGCPGTANIPAPAALPETGREHTALAQTGIIGLSSSDFSTWRPSVYYEPKPQAAPGNPVSGPGMAIESDNQMPIPAKSPLHKPAVMAKAPQFTGKRQVGWPVTTPSFSWLNS